MTIEKTGKGVEYSISKEYITIRFKRNGNHGFSSTEKSITVATTGGAEEIAGIQVNLNAYVKNPAYKKGQAVKPKAKPKAQAHISMND